MFGVWMLKFVVIRLSVMFENIVNCKQSPFFPIPNPHHHLHHHHHCLHHLHHPPTTTPKNLHPALPPHQTLTITIKPSPFTNTNVNDNPLINCINNIKNVNICNKINNR